MATKRIPDGEPHIIPYLSVRDGTKALELYEKALGATVEARSVTPDGKLIHGRLRIGNALFFVSDEFGPPGPAPAGTTVHVWSEDADVLWAQATAAGFEETMPLADQFWGDRYGQLRDPFGHKWSIGHRIEDLTPEEIERRGQEFFANMPKMPS
ncbi:MAG: VOC family protein [Myxococcota bacterium]